MTLWSQVWSFLGRKRQVDPLIRLEDGGFSIVDASSQVALRTVPWRNVSRIQTYKLDRLTTDCICLLFEFRSGEPPVQVSEEWDGFATLMTSMSAAFPTIPANWYAEVMLPPFAYKQTLLFETSDLQNSTAA